MFITVSLIRFYTDSSVEFLTAGHLPILYFNKQLNKVQHLLIKQIPLTAKENFNFSSGIMKYSAGDIFIMITGGIIEVMDENKVLFGLNKIEEILIENCNENSKFIFDCIGNEIGKFGNQKDDQSAIIIKSI
jgi:serine phosphatase RsbU (regulator of sigma subunit)